MPVVRQIKIPVTRTVDIYISHPVDEYVTKLQERIFLSKYITFYLTRFHTIPITRVHTVVITRDVHKILEEARRAYVAANYLSQMGRYEEANQAARQGAMFLATTLPPLRNPELAKLHKPRPELFTTSVW